MNEPSANPLWVALLCAARCIIPFLILLVISYVIRKLGLVAEPPPPPEEGEELDPSAPGGIAHGSL